VIKIQIVINLMILLTEIEGRDKTSASGSGKNYESKGLISPPPISLLHFNIKSYPTTVIGLPPPKEQLTK
jgi:hypothetical protein